MKLFALILPLVFAFTVTGCNNSSETKTSEADNATDSMSTPNVEQEDQDTTMQPRVELMLRATGDTPEEMAFDQDTLHVEKNSLIKLSLVNEGAGMTMIHNFVLVTDGKYKEAAIIGAKLGATDNYIPKTNYVLASTPLALPGQTVVQEFKAPPPGTYDFVCTYPEHWQRMHGKLIVK